MGRSREITGLVASIVTVLAMGVAVARDATVAVAQGGSLSSRPTFDCAKAKSPLSLLICSGEETARADWDLEIASWARYFSLDKHARATFWQGQDKWLRSLNEKCRLSAPPFSREQTSCIIDAYAEGAALYRSKLRDDALAESKLTPEQLSQIQQTLFELGVFNGEADGVFGPTTRVAIRKYHEANSFPQSDFLSIEQQRVLLEGRTGPTEPPKIAPSREAPPPSPPPQPPATKQRAKIEPAAQPNGPPSPSRVSTLAPPAERSRRILRNVATSGNGCGGFGVVIIDEIEKIAAEINKSVPRNDLERDRPLIVFKDRLDERMRRLFGDYLNFIDSPYDTRDIFVPDMDKIDRKTIRDCLPNFSKMIDSVSTTQKP